MVGVDDAYKLNDATSAEDARMMCDLPAVSYARLFAECDGVGPKEAKAFELLASELGAGKASSTRAICWFLYWGSFTGSTSH